MPGTGPRQRAAIAIAFGVQAVLIAGALALPAEQSSPASVPVFAPAPVMLLPAVSPLASGAPFPAPLSVTVRVGAASGTWTALSGPPVLVTEPDRDAIAIITVTLHDAYQVGSLSFLLADQPPLRASAPGGAAAGQSRLDVPGPLSKGTHTFALHLGRLSPRTGEGILMLAAPPGSPGVTSSVIAEIVTS